MTRWRLRVAAVVAVAGLWTGVANAAPSQANVVVIVADDLGYADIGVQGLAKDVKTPHIDSIATNGVRFTQGYVSCPVCSPTRAGIMTGMYQQRFGHEVNPGNPVPKEFGLPVEQVTIADDFKAAGYVTGAVGKWHLGLAEQFHPQKRGFDEFFGFLHGAHSYFNASTRPNDLPILRGEKPVRDNEYLTTSIGREACDFIDRHQKQKFFLYVAFNAVHTPQQVTEKYLDRFADVKDDRRRHCLAMLSAMDDMVGDILARLQKSGLTDNTLIVFLSDNGGITANNGSINTPLSGFKQQLWEGGIRVPFMMQWKGHLPAGKVIEQPVISLDILPTALAAANAPLSKPRPLDGVNLLPLLQGKADKPPHETLYWRFGSQRAVRQGDLKWVKFNDKDAALVFDVKADPGEDHNLAFEKPELAKSLEAVYQKWDATLIAPAWQPRSGDANRPRRGLRRMLQEAATKPTTLPADDGD